MAFQAPKWQGDPERFTTELLDWLEAAGAARYDEMVTQYEHAVQSAALAAQRGGNPALVVAALLHDVGHLLVAEHRDRNGFLARDLEHERVGAGWLSRTFGADVTEPIRMHVDAKRYLCSIDVAYFNGLSESSKRSFELQGGMMGADEIKTFLTRPAVQVAIELRRIDDLAKQLDRVVPGASEYRLALLQALRTHFR
ncbi:MAG TPA: HD domain-containing protein [Casimicrobiaceae bacterium]|jgi:phosphonate degradation associated HDIG domain protein|nr:HD domain-containing protein [Casimicrobiaceae bacterium]